MNVSVDKITESVKPVIERLGCEVVAVEFSKAHGDTHLTVFIAKEPFVTLDDCERVHLAIDPILDGLNPTGDAPYTLNVSSPGLDRPFQTLRDFQRNYGKKVEVKLYAPFRGKKVYEGVLIEKLENVVVLEIQNEMIRFEDGKTVFVRPFVSFDGLINQTDEIKHQ